MVERLKTLMIAALLAALAGSIALACSSDAEPAVAEQDAQGEQQQAAEQPEPAVAEQDAQGEQQAAEQPEPAVAEQDAQGEQQAAEQPEPAVAEQDAQGEQQATEQPKVEFADIEPAAPVGVRTSPVKSDHPIDKYLFRWTWLTGDFNGGGNLYDGCQRVTDSLLWSDSAGKVAALPQLKWCFENLTREIRAARDQLYQAALTAYPGITYNATMDLVDALIEDVKQNIEEARSSLG